MAKKITWLEAAEIIGVCDRTMRRMREQDEGGRNRETGAGRTTEMISIVQFGIGILIHHGFSRARFVFLRYDLRIGSIAALKAVIQ